MRCDTSGRAIIFDIGGVTFGNFYAHSGTDARSRSSRENFCAEVVPQLITNTRQAGCIGGDWNCITAKADATKNPEAKLSNSLKRVVNTFDMTDSFRTLHPKAKAYSRYYDDVRGNGASRIDRQYHWGDITIKDAQYLPLSFSDHHGLVVQVALPDHLERILCPKCRSSFRLKADVINDQLFQCCLSNAMLSWKRIQDFGLETLQWWELIVKPGIRKLAISRSRQMCKDKKDELNLLLVMQAHLNKKVKMGNFQLLGDLKSVHQLI